jgi:hypothetical protein
MALIGLTSGVLGIALFWDRIVAGFLFLGAVFCLTVATSLEIRKIRK